MDKDKLYGISDLADEFGLTHRAMRLYEEKGLLSPQRINSTRIYSYRDRARLEIIQRGKRMGFSLQEIAEYMELYALNDGQIEQSRMLLNRVEDRIQRLRQQQEDLAETLADLHNIKQQVEAHLRRSIAAEGVGDQPMPTPQPAKGAKHKLTLLKAL